MAALDGDGGLTHLKGNVVANVPALIAHVLAMVAAGQPSGRRNTMHTLLLRLAGPMQSWGTHSRFSIRDTGREPSKSGVIGLLCAALGRPREEPVDDLARLLMGVRIDREGRLLRDFQTALDVVKASGARSDHAVLSNRDYLADADFLVGLCGNSLPLLQRLDDALRSDTGSSRSDARRSCQGSPFIPQSVVFARIWMY